MHSRAGKRTVDLHFRNDKKQRTQSSRLSVIFPSNQRHARNGHTAGRRGERGERALEGWLTCQLRALHDVDVLQDGQPHKLPPNTQDDRPARARAHRGEGQE